MTLLIGDSIGLSIDDNLPARYVVDAVVGRQFSTGLIVVKARKAQRELHKRMVIELGTNGPIAKADIAMMVETLKGKLVWFVNNYLPDEPQYAYQASNNRLIKGACDGMSVNLIRWHRLATQNPAWFKWDPLHVHPDSAGQQALADLIVEAIG